MNKSILYASNTGSQAVASGDSISFGSIVRRSGCNCTLSGTSVALRGSGYYGIDTSFTFTATSAGTAVITLYKDGVAITGATTELTVVADTIYSVSIPAVVRQLCANSVITAVITGVSATINNASIVVEKV